MQGLTLIFHVFSACVILGMTAWIIRLQGQKRFQLLLWGSVSPESKRVYLDWPEVYLDKFCQAIGARYSLNSNSRGKPCSIKPYYWVKAHVNFNILSVQLNSHDEAEVQILIEPDNRIEWEQLLQQAMPRLKKIHITKKFNRSAH